MNRLKKWEAETRGQFAAKCEGQIERNIQIMIRILTSCLIFLLVADLSNAQPTIAWNQLFTLPGKGITLKDYKMDSQGNLNLAVDIFDSTSTTLTSAVVEYDPSGQISWHFINPLLLSSQSKRLFLDQYDNVYLLTWDAASKNHVVKVDGSNGGFIFDYPLDSSFYSAEMVLDSNFIYLVQSAPDLLLTKLDLAGNLVFTSQINYIDRIYSIKKVGNDLVFIGDTILNSMQWAMRLHHLTTSGTYINKFSSPVLSPTVTDIEIVSDSLVYITGSGLGTSLLPYIQLFNLQGGSWDTIINVSNTATAMGKFAEMNGVLYWSFVRASPTGTFYYLNFVNYDSISNVTSNDSCRVFNFDMCVDSNNVIYSATAFMPSTPYYDWDINAYNPSSGLIWNLRYTLTSNSRDIPEFVDEHNGSLYILGNSWDNLINQGGSKVNILKLNTITGIDNITTEYDNNFIYPNPTFSRIIYFKNNLKNTNISIYDMKGVLVKTVKELNGTSIDLNEINPGVYLIKIKTNNWSKTQKLILY